MLRHALWAVVGILFLVADARSQAPAFIAPQGGQANVPGPVIRIVDGPGNWILSGNNQDVVIQEKKDGDGNLTLRGFRNVTITEKNGNGHLVIEDCTGTFTITDIMNGAGNAYLRIPGPKSIRLKDGPGNVYFWGQEPTFPQGVRNGRPIRER